MGQAVATLSIPALSAADLNTAINHVPRIMDLRLGEALGFERVRNIRKLVQRHIETLKAFGEVCSTWSKPSAQGGRPSRTYWLNKRQALFITAKSDTELAAHVTVRMVEIFDEVMSGDLVAVSAHRRQPRASRIFDGSQRGRGCVVLDRPVFFDAGRVPAIGEPALVVLHDGSLGVFPVAGESDAGFVQVVDQPPPSWARRVTSKVALIGAVTTPSGRTQVTR